MKRSLIVVIAVSAILVIAVSGWIYSYVHQQSVINSGKKTAQDIQKLVSTHGKLAHATELSDKSCRDVYGGKRYFNEHPQYCFYFSSAEIVVSDTDVAYKDIKAQMNELGWRQNYQPADCLTLYATQIGSFKHLTTDNSNIECYDKDNSNETVVMKIIPKTTIMIRYEIPS